MISLGIGFGPTKCNKGGAAWTPAALTPAWWHSADSGAYADAGASFASASSQSLSIASNSTLQTGNVDFWLAGWFYPTSTTGQRNVAYKDVLGSREYGVYYSGSTLGAAVFLASAPGLANPTIASAVTANAWHFFMVYHDSAADTVGLSVNGGAFTTATTGGAAPVSATANFTLGARQFVGAEGYVDGQIDSVAFGKSPPGGITALATTIRDRLYNSGSGLRYADLTAQEKTDWGLVSWYDFASSGAGLTADSHGTNTLTNNNGVTLGAGVPQGLATADGDPVSSWRDQSGNARHLLQATYSKRPTLKLAVAPSGLNCLDFDGVDDYLRASFTLAQPVTIFLAGYLRAVGASGANDIVLDSSGGSTMAFMSYDTPQTQLYAGTSLTASGAAMSSWAQVTLKFNGSSSLVRVNGSDVASGNAGSATPGGLTLAALGGGSGSRFTQLRIGEIFGVAGDVTGASLAAAEAYLRSKWGTP